MGNSQNQHVIKKRHVKKYYKKILASKEGISLFDFETFMPINFNDEYLRVLGWENKRKLLLKADPKLLSMPYQPFYKCGVEEALQLVSKACMSSEKGTMTLAWDVKSHEGEKIGLWVYITLIKLGKKNVGQAIYKRRAKQEQVEEELQKEKPLYMDPNLLKMDFQDNSNESESTSIPTDKESFSKGGSSSNMKKDNSKESKQSSFNNNSEQMENIQNEVDDLSHKLKNMIRSLSEPQKEKEMVDDLNRLVTLFEIVTQDRDKKLMEFQIRMKNDREKAKKKYKQLEEHLNKRLSTMENVKDTKNKLFMGNKKQKQMISKVYNLLNEQQRNTNDLLKQIEKDKDFGIKTRVKKKKTQTTSNNHTGNN
ncbi:hypothetical protein M0813_29943 [Anaeramoeba flamelloides]|uniref:Uncharacterized protein n=1 Tax=Anaeramoeba flamelloides TaxID=1746091 RepID=A0ABQ8XM03_9EUKA|nr:hypothetical protein M0813_29943 [Anaeramoeba flamelloides]